MTSFRATKGTIFKGGFRVPVIIRWPGKIKPGVVEKFSSLDWFLTQESPSWLQPEMMAHEGQ